MLPMTWGKVNSSRGYTSSIKLIVIILLKYWWSFVKQTSMDHTPCKQQRQRIYVWKQASFLLLIVVLFLFLGFMVSDYPVGIFNLLFLCVRHNIRLIISSRSLKKENMANISPTPVSSFSICVCILLPIVPNVYHYDQVYPLWDTAMKSTSVG